MLINRALVAGITVVGTVAAGAVVAVAAADDDDNRIRVRLTGYQEDPAPISTDGSGTFTMQVDEDEEKITYQLSYSDLSSDVLQAHIHFAGKAQSGGISAWLCETDMVQAPAPADPPTCPDEGTVTGTIEADDVVGPSAQGIEPGEFDELLAALDAHRTYVNVHTQTYPTGEIRSQLTHRGHR